MAICHFFLACCKKSCACFRGVQTHARQPGRPSANSGHLQPTTNPSPANTLMLEGFLGARNRPDFPEVESQWNTRVEAQTRRLSDAATRATRPRVPGPVLADAAWAACRRGCGRCSPGQAGPSAGSCLLTCQCILVVFVDLYFACLECACFNWWRVMCCGGVWCVGWWLKLWGDARGVLQGFCVVWCVAW